jgi:hypothetical protein
MQTAGQTEALTATARGTIQEVDVLGRELCVLVDGSPEHFAVPLGCAVWLHGERVKLRLLQPQDPVEVVYSPAGGRNEAHCVRVSWAVEAVGPARPFST